MSNSISTTPSEKSLDQPIFIFFNYSTLFNLSSSPYLATSVYSTSRKHSTSARRRRVHFLRYSTNSHHRSPSLCSPHTRPSLRRCNRVPRLVHRQNLRNYSIPTTGLGPRLVVPSLPIPAHQRSAQPLDLTGGTRPQVFTQPLQLTT